MWQFRCLVAVIFMAAKNVWLTVTCTQPAGPHEEADGPRETLMFF